MSDCKKHAELITLYHEYYNGSPAHQECTYEIEGDFKGGKEHKEAVERLEREGKITRGDLMTLSDTANIAAYEGEVLGFVMGFEYAKKLLMTN